jgi:hypothetical protein
LKTGAGLAIHKNLSSLKSHDPIQRMKFDPDLT